MARVKEADCCSEHHPLNALTENMLTDAPSLSAMLSNVGSLPAENQPILEDSNYLTPTKDEAEAKPNCETPVNQAASLIDFSVLTAADFGITPTSFTKQCTGQSKSWLQKLKRRSTIGVRGSPENDSLIRYIACQKRPRKQNTLSQVEDSPFKHQNRLLKDKMAAFQSSFKPLEEESHILSTSTATNDVSRPDEQSKLSQVESFKWKRFAFEESLDHKSAGGKRASTDIQVCNGVSPPNEPLITSTVSKAIPILQPNTIETGCLPLETTQSTDISKTACGIPSEGTKEGVISKATSLKGNKKVRFAEKHLEIVDETKPTITPQREGCFPSCVLYSNGPGLRSVLKKTSVKMVAADLKDLLQKSEVVSAMNSDDQKETTNSSDVQVACFRSTRSSAKRKSGVIAEKVNLDFPTPVRVKQVSVINNETPSKFQKTKPAAKSASQKTPVSRYKAFGRRRRKKKEQKALYGPREIASKKPLLSPIPEMMEDFSFLTSSQSTPKSQISILDDSTCSIESMNEATEKKNDKRHGTGEDTSCQHSSQDLVEEDSLSDIPCSTAQMPATTVTDKRNRFPLDPNEVNAPEKQKVLLNETQLVLNCDFSSNEPELQEELGLLNLQGAAQNDTNSGALLLAVDSAELLGEGDIGENFNRVPRKSKKVSFYLPNDEVLLSETSSSHSSILGENTEQPPTTPLRVNALGLVNNLQYCVEEPFRRAINSNQKMVRRSMRKLIDTENEGLAWIQIPTHDFAGHALLGSARKARRRTFAFCCHESELFRQKQEGGNQTLSPAKEEQRGAVAALGSGRSRKRMSICVTSLGENKKVIPRMQRSRRASLGYTNASERV